MKVISYVRVSTQRQGESGLGLEAQREAVAVYCKAHGFSLIEEFVEVESGRKTCRPVLLRALQAAKRAKAVLLIAKIDRLARNVAFIANMMEAGVEFRACDMPEANRLMLHIMAAFAEHEARTISERTKAALTAAKARGQLLGAANPASQNLTQEAREHGAKVNAAAATVLYASVAGAVRDLRSQGASLRSIAATLTHDGHATRNGGAWSASQVARVLASR